MTDIAALKNNTNIVEVISAHVSLTKRGQEFYGICPFHDDHKQSLQVNEKKQVFKCFACGEGGDAIDFLTALGKPFGEAIKELSGGASSGVVNPISNQSKKPKAAEWKPAKPTAPPSSLTHYTLGEPTGKWLYRHGDGTPFGYVLRFDTPKGKRFSQYWYGTDGNREAWIWKGFPLLRPLYNLHLLTKHTKAAVLIVEGEKCADAAQKLLDPAKTVVTTWQHGAGSVHKNDWEPIRGRRLIMWGDNDCEGLSSILHIAHLLKPEKAKYIPLDQKKPKKWDLADEQWTAETFKKFIKDNMQPLPELGKIYTAIQPERGGECKFGMKDGRWQYKDLSKAKPSADSSSADSSSADSSSADSSSADSSSADSSSADSSSADSSSADPKQPAKPKGENSPTPKPPEKAPKPPKEGPPPQKAQADKSPFRFLGYGKNEQGTQSFYFYVYRSKQVVRLSASSMTKVNLMTLAPLNWWELLFPAKDGMKLTGAQNWLIEGSLEVGLYDPENTRGRGAWMDGDDVVVHAGAHLIVNGKKTSFEEYASDHTYEKAAALSFGLGKPASNRAAHRLIDLCTLINWDRPVNAYLLAGWCAIAPVCGALRWRPHIWLTGAAGTGKSWLLDNVVKRMLGKVCLSVEGESTAAGIRQWLSSDALPIVFDEAEGESHNDQKRMEGVMTLMRSASSSSESKIAKGDTAGNGIRYSLRACFAYASIGVQLSQRSDRSRVSVLSISAKQGEEAAAQWEALQRAYSECMSDGFPDKLKARTVELLPVILENVETFSDAATAYFGDKRSGDQIGTLLAGAYSLVSPNPIGYDEALKWIKAREWGEVNSEEEKDERRLLNTLMEYITIFESPDRMKLERTLGELIRVCWEPGIYVPADSLNYESEARERLNRLGFRVDKEKGILLVSNSSTQIQKMLKDTPWTKNFSNILKRIEGAEAYGSTTFGAHTKSRAIAIPLEKVFN